jgi:hypothetical protein
MFGKIMAAVAAIAIFGWLSAEPVQARGGGGGGGHGGGGHGGGGHGGGWGGGRGGWGGGGWGGHGGGWGHGGFHGNGFGRGFYGYPFYGFGLGYGLGLGLGYGGYGYGGYGGYGYGGSGYGGYPYDYGYDSYPYGGAYGAYASPYASGYNYPPPLQSGYSRGYPGYLQMPSDDSATYPYNGNPANAPPLPAPPPAPVPRKAPDSPKGTLPLNGLFVSQPAQKATYRFAAYGESPETEQAVQTAVQARQMTLLRVAYPAYGETLPAVTITTRLRR